MRAEDGPGLDEAVTAVSAAVRRSALLLSLPQALAAEDDEVRQPIESERLHGRGIGWADAHPSASAGKEAGTSPPPSSQFTPDR